MQGRYERVFRSRFSLLAVSLTAAFLLGAPLAAAATITVDTTAETSGTQCTLPAAITAANGNFGVGTCDAGSPGPAVDTIDIAATGTINLSTALPDISTDMNIDGPGAAQLDVHRASGPAFRIFTTTNNATVSISDLTVSNGSAPAGTDSGGGGILNNAATVTLDRVTVSGNSATASDNSNGGFARAYGGGIANFGTMIVRRSTVVGNTATATATGTNANTAGAIGAGIANISGTGSTLTIERSTVSGNIAAAHNTNSSAGSQAFAQGGGVANAGSSTNPLSLRLSTVTGNQAVATVAAGVNVSALGGGVQNNGELTAVSDTIAFNTGVGAANYAGGGPSASFKNSIISDPQGGPSCSLAPTSSGFNLEGPNPGPNPLAGTCGFNQTTDRTNIDPQLGPLADNGGPTQTRALPLTSPAVDQGSSFGDATDQRELLRPVDFASITNADDGADIGAFELQPPTIPPDATPPNTSIDSGPKKKAKKRKVKFTFSSSESGSTFMCKIDKKAAKPCSSPKTYRLKPGKHRFLVTAIDAAGNADPSPAQRKFKIKRS
jgi:hypothetical protein